MHLTHQSDSKSITTKDRRDKATNEGVSLPSRTIVHAKLEMTSPQDAEELEADAVANEIVSGGKIRRKISQGGSGSSGIAVSSQMESQLSRLQGGGQQMPTGLLKIMENGFGRDLSQVRLHTDSDAATMSSSIHAKAFTHGNDIYFNRGQFAPETTEGQRLVAHELTHVAQGNEMVARDFNYFFHNGSDNNDLMFLNNLNLANYSPDIQQEILAQRHLAQFVINNWNQTNTDPRNFLNFSQNDRRKLNSVNHDLHIIMAHGSPESIRYSGQEITDPKVLLQVFKNEGKEIKDHDIIIFSSCWIASNNSTSTDNFAVRFSRLLPNNLVIAASSNITVREGTNFSCITNGGMFRIFRGGKEWNVSDIFDDEIQPVCIWGNETQPDGMDSFTSPSSLKALSELEDELTILDNLREMIKNLRLPIIDDIIKNVLYERINSDNFRVYFLESIQKMYSILR